MDWSARSRRLLEPDRFFKQQTLQSNPEVDLIYSDEDKLTEEVLLHRAQAGLVAGFFSFL